MKFTWPIEFEIPDEWWIESGMSDFQPVTNSYVLETSSQWPTAIVRLSEIEPPRRDEGVSWFKQDKLMPVLKGLVKGDAIPPIEAHELPSPNSFRYALRDGFHRFYAFAAAGFEFMPLEIKPYFNIREGRT